MICEDHKQEPIGPIYAPAETLICRICGGSYVSSGAKDDGICQFCKRKMQERPLETAAAVYPEVVEEKHSGMIEDDDPEPISSSGKIEVATRWMEHIANDNSFGYLWGGWGPKEFDCGHAIITAWENAGVPVKSAGASYTGNMYEIFNACGFEDVTGLTNRETGAGMRRGDVLLNKENHAAMFCGAGKIVHARSAEGNCIPGDQNGREICIQDYINFPWDAILRYPERDEETEDADGIPEDKTPVRRMTGYFPLLKRELENEEREDVAALQCLLQLRGFVSVVIAGEEYPVTINGFYNDVTEQAVKDAQKLYCLEKDGECGSATWTALING